MEVKRMKEIIVAAITAGKSPAEVKDYADILITSNNARSSNARGM